MCFMNRLPSATVRHGSTTSSATIGETTRWAPCRHSRGAQIHPVVRCPAGGRGQLRAWWRGCPGVRRAGSGPCGQLSRARRRNGRSSRCGAGRPSGCARSTTTNSCVSPLDSACTVSGVSAARSSIGRGLTRPKIRITKRGALSTSASSTSSTSARSPVSSHSSRTARLLPALALLDEPAGQPDLAELRLDAAAHGQQAGPAVGPDDRHHHQRHRQRVEPGGLAAVRAQARPQGRPRRRRYRSRSSGSCGPAWFISVRRRFTG